MIINKIGFSFNKNFQLNEHRSQPAKNNNYVSNSIDLSKDYYVSFTANQKNHNETKFDKIMYMADTPSKNMLKTLWSEAKSSGYDKITTMHVIKNQLIELDKYIDDINSGKEDFDSINQPIISRYLSDVTSNYIIQKPEQRKLVQPVIKEYIAEADKVLCDKKPASTKNKDKILLSEDLTDSIWTFVNDVNEKNINPYIIFECALTSPDDDTSAFREKFILAVYAAIMENNSPIEERAPFSDYEKKAKNVLKNLSLGTNMFVTYDSSKDTYVNFMDTIQKINAEEGRYDLIELNTLAKSDYFAQVVSQCAKDKEHEYIIAAPPVRMLYNDSDVQLVAEGKLQISPDFVISIQNQPSNVKFLFYDTKTNCDSFNSLIGGGAFEEVRIPTLSTDQMVKTFKENPVLMKDVQIPFSKKAIEKTVEASAQLEGVFPEKTQKLMKNIVSYYIDKKEINEKDVAAYVKEATHLFNKNSDDSAIEVVFDTGKRLKDMVGKTSTQKEADSLVKQIKSKKMGTKGVIIFSQDGSAGAGRRFTAKAIAGEAKVPYIEINTMDFGTKEVELFGGGILSPEASVKKLFSMVTAQAEANSNKSAVLFIDNFEYFSVGELVSLYHQKAMAQLLREMEKADKAGLNILVIGSVSNPSLLGEAAMKSFKFIDSIAVSSPAFNEDLRLQVIDKALKKEKVKLAGSKEEQQEILEFAAQITEYFPYIHLKNLVKKTAAISSERGHKAVNKSDFTEAYLQITTGRPLVERIQPHERKIVASHECGHATNLEVMNNIAKTLGNPWHIPSRVNFITLDPRGSYGAAVYKGNDNNREYSFEAMFSDMVCAFGGNSAEHRFYGMDGSYGITCDMAAVRNSAENMVKVMGMGAKTGKMVIDEEDDLSDGLKKIIEDDERVIINNAQITSDLITKIYADFNREFTKKYAPLAGTGDCIMNGDDFRRSLNEWKSKQSPEKQKELKECDETILKIIEATKKGIAVRKAEMD